MHLDDYNIKWDGSPEGKFEVRTSGKKESSVGGTPPKVSSYETKEEDEELTPVERAKKLKKFDEKAEIERDDDGKAQKEK